MKTRLIDKLLYRYQGILKEVIAQKSLFKTESEYRVTLCKIQGYINTVQSIQLYNLITKS